MGSSNVAARRAVFLDRDGVLNAAEVRDGRPYPPARLADMRLLPGVPEACARLKAAGFLLIVVTNQPDIARRRTDAAEVDAINVALKERLHLDEICVCPHDDADGCDCRKPKPGLITAAARRWNIDLAASFLVGDRWRDIAAGEAAGCRTVFVDHGYAERRPERPTIVTTSLAAVADDLIGADAATSTPLAGADASDDWNRHWEDYKESAVANPAQDYRRKLILAKLDLAGAAAPCVLDIGSGLGDFLIALHARHPDIAKLGLELSRRGVEIAARRLPGVTFLQRNLMAGDEDPAKHRGFATHAVCSEVLEHVDDPVRLLRNARPYMADGCRLVVTVPGGPMSAYDRHIGHRRHFTPADLAHVLAAAGFTVETATGAGFPFFNLYRLTVILRGARLKDDASGEPGALLKSVSAVFRLLFRFNLAASPFGWQTLAVARK